MVASLIISISFYANPPKFIGPLFSKIKSKPLNIQGLDNRFPDWNGKL